MTRGVKQAEEITLIKKACMITDTIFSRLMGRFSTFATERDIAEFIHKEIKKYGCTQSFRPIVASGTNAAHPHHRPTDSKLVGFTVIDFGVVYKGYCSDMTRTLYVGTPNITERNRYKKVLRALEESRYAAVSGVRASVVDAVARKELGGVLNKLFIHALGHGVGKRVHEFPRISSRSNFFLKADMIITLEPGVYKEGAYGIRIEDTCRVVKGGCLPLTKSPKDLIVI